MSKVLCIYHANCADGIGAAWAVHHALGDDVEFVAARYGEDPPFKRQVQSPPAPAELPWMYEDYRGRDVLVVDFSYPLPVLRAMAAEARSVLVLDHHKTAREDLSEITAFMKPEGIPYRELVKDHMRDSSWPNLAAIFDLDRSGAGLTWDYLHPGVPRPHIIDLIEDRDLWKFRFGDETRAFHAALTSYDISDLPAMFEWLNKWSEQASFQRSLDERSHMVEGESDWSRTMREGRAILRAQRQAVAAAVAASRRTLKIAGHIVPCANVPGSMASDAGHLLCQGGYRCAFCGAWQLERDPAFCHRSGCVEPNRGNGTMMRDNPPFSATYHDGADGKRHFSLRSPEGGADVGQIAKQVVAYHPRDPEGKWLGCSGGGHEHAAGFDAPLGWDGE